MNAVSIREWETAHPDPGSALAQQSLDPAGRKLAERLTSAGRIEVLELARGLELRATSFFVGRFSLGELTVTIHPKIPYAPLLGLFRYAYGLRQLELIGRWISLHPNGACKNCSSSNSRPKLANCFSAGCIVTTKPTAAISEPTRPN